MAEDGRVCMHGTGKEECLCLGFSMRASLTLTRGSDSLARRAGSIHPSNSAFVDEERWRPGSAGLQADSELAVSVCCFAPSHALTHARTHEQGARVSEIGAAGRQHAAAADRIRYRTGLGYAPTRPILFCLGPDSCTANTQAVSLRVGKVCVC